MNCDLARPLVPLYVDGELAETQATALRPHLLECPGCRAVAQEAKTLKAWFVPTAPVAVPEGFAARVARRAMAGDTGERFEPARSGEAPVLQFVLQAVAAAALLLLTFSIAIRSRDIPAGDDLQAEDRKLDESLDALDRLNGVTLVREGAEEEREDAEDAEDAEAREER